MAHRFNRARDHGWAFTIRGIGYVARRNEAGFKGRDWEVYEDDPDGHLYMDGFGSRAEAVAYVQKMSDIAESMRDTWQAIRVEAGYEA